MLNTQRVFLWRVAPRKNPSQEFLSRDLQGVRSIRSCEEQFQRAILVMVSCLSVHISRFEYPDSLSLSRLARLLSEKVGAMGVTPLPNDP